MAASQYNLRSPAVKRLMREAEELHEPTEEYFAQPLEDNLFEWHFTVKGPSDSDFEDGFYHGRIILPTEYPMKPPSIILLTPNGRFETNKKICLSISGHHPESWQPSWSIRTALLAIIGFMPTEGLGAIGSLDFSPEERKTLAVKSKTWSCPSCGKISCLLKERSTSPEASGDVESTAADKEAKELAKQICFKGSETTGPKSRDNEPTSTEVQQPLPDSSVQDDEENSQGELRYRRNVQDSPAGVEHSIMSESINTSSDVGNNNMNLDSSRSTPLLSTYLIIVLTTAIACLLLRRILFVD